MEGDKDAVPRVVAFVYTAGPDAIAEYDRFRLDATEPQLRRALEAKAEAQLRAAGKLVANVPSMVAVLLTAAFEAVRAVEKHPWWSDSKYLVAVAKHFLDVWEPLLPKKKTRSQKIRERDLGWCQVPGCSRRAKHAHHIIPKSRGGTDDPGNLVGLCTCHHLYGIHGGFIRVSGTAPARLKWELGGRVWSGVGRQPTASPLMS